MKLTNKKIGVFSIIGSLSVLFCINATVWAAESKISCQSAMKMYIDAKKICFNTKLSDGDKNKVKNYLSATPKNKDAVKSLLDNHVEFSQCVKPLKDALEAKLSAESCGKLQPQDDE